MKEIQDKLIAIISDYVDIEAKNVTMDTDLKFDMGLDSFAMISMICAIESEFGIEIPDAKCAEFNTLNDLVQFIYQQTNK